MPNKVCVLQTASGAAYERMLELTSIPTRAFCAIKGYEYRSYVGVKRGYYDWQATYNRAPMLEELVLEGFDGWVLFIDADAYVKNPDFDLEAYLTSLDEKVALVVAPGAHKAPWDVNAGVFLLNLGSETGRRIVSEWRDLEGKWTPDRMLRAVAEPWGKTPNGDVLLNDQAMLHHILQHSEDLGAIMKVEDHLINYSHGAFIAQIIRHHSVGMQSRLDVIGAACLQIFRSNPFFSWKDLTKLANHYGTDKGDQVGNAHSYTKYYSFLFEQFRFERFNALEIGLLRGGPEAGGTAGRDTRGIPSIDLWLEYFPFANLYGIDISDFRKFQSPRFQFHELDLSNLDEALQVAKRLPPMKLVIEDASHATFHQQVAFAAFFPLVESGGYYIIEDCNWQPEHFENELPTCQLTRDLFREFMYFRVAKFSDPVTSVVDIPALLDQITDVFVHRNEIDGGGYGTIKFFALRKK